MTRLTIVLFALVALCATSAFANMSVSAPEMKLLWNSWKQLNSKIYNTEVEEMKRFGIFVENYFLIVASNVKNSGVKYALNDMADLTQEEFEQIYTSGLIVDERQLKHNAVLEKLEASSFLGPLSTAESVDWRTKGAVTDVKNQARCGSCWAFSATGALEGLHYVKAGELLSLSEQNLVDCDKTSLGCNGGLMIKAFAHTAAKGIELETDYPYVGVDQKCSYDASKAQHVNTGFKNIPANNVAAMKAALNVQPVSVAIQANEQAFRFYSSGVIKTGCGRALNHGVLAVGYASVNGEEAFIVKNSWGTTWGNQGYVMISTDKSANAGSGVCGILAMASVPTA